MLFYAAIVALTLLSTISAQANVAFSASLSKHMPTFIKRDQLVVFDNVQTNQDNAYDSTTGVFTATKGGLYQFQVFILSQKGTIALTRLYKNNEVLGTAYNLPGANGYGGVSVIVRITKGDRVYVKTVNDSFIQGDNQKSSRFSGLLVG